MIMATTTAKNYNDVEGMSKRERLWDSLNYSYGKKGERLAQEYDKARATADRQMQSRGMQRSSYGAQTLANMDRQKIDALDDNQSAMIADYESRLQDIEAQELAQNNWERQFAEGQRQFDEGQSFQRSENALNRAFQTSEREAQQGWQSNENALNRNENRYQFETNLNYQRERDAVGDRQWQQNFAEGQRQFNEQIGLNRDQFDWQREQAAAKASAASGGGRGGSYSSPSTTPATTTPAAGTTNSDRTFLDTFGLGTDARGTVSSGDLFYLDHKRREASLANDFEKLKNSLKK
jgi:hypothetical protein